MRLLPRTLVLVFLLHMLVLPATTAQAEVARAFAPPLAFVPNAGQVDSSVRYYGRGDGYSVYFTSEEAVFALARQQPVAIALRFLGASAAATLQGEAEAAAKVNFLVGDDAARWRTGLPTYQEVRYANLWAGVDLVFRRAGGRVKYEVLVRPGADLRTVQLAYRGSDGMALDETGNLIVRTAGGTLTDERPVSYQLIQGRRVPVETRFVLAAGGAYGFAAGAEYDARYPLVIDPGFRIGDFSTLVGGTGTDGAAAIAVDSAGNAYIAGQTDSPDFPTTVGASFKSGSKTRGLTDAFVAKLDVGGNLVFVTYLGGTDADAALAIAVDGSGNAHVTGYTYSADFPTTPGAFSTKIRGNADAFVTKLNSAGSAPIFSTFIGGGGFDAGHAIALDGGGNVYIAGETLSSNYPVTPGAFASSQGKRDAFVSKLTASGSALVYSTYLGGSGDDVAYGLALGCPAGSTLCTAYVTGQTSSPNFPLVTPLDPKLNGPSDAFVAQLNATASGLMFSTFLGGAGDDAGYAIAVDSTGAAFVTGTTNSADFPTTAGAWQRALKLNGGIATADAFIAKLAPTGSALAYSTLLGGSGDDAGFGIALDGAGTAYVAGQTTSADFPTTSGAVDGTYGGNTDAFISKLSPDGSALVHSTFLGGTGMDAARAIAFGCTSATDCSAWVAGSTTSHDFPTTVGPSLNLNNVGDNSADAFVAKLALRAATSVTLTASPSGSAVFGQTLTLTATVAAVPAGAGTATGSVTFLDGTTVLATRTLAGGTASFSTSALTVGSHTLTAQYAGDGNFDGGVSAALTETVGRASSATTLAVSPSAPVFGQPLTITAAVTAVAPGAGTATGSVTFLDGSTTLGTGALDAAGQSSITVSTLTAGSHSLSATYSGDANFAGSTGVPPGGSSLTVAPASTTTVVAASPSPSAVGQSVTFTVTVTVTPPGVGTVTGTVTLRDGSTILGTASLDATAHASFVTAALAVGAHAITAQYGGTASFAGSTSATLTHTVNAGSTTTTISASAASTTFGQGITFTASVAAVPPAIGTPSGTVEFRDYTNVIGTSALVNGQATLTTTALGVGLHSVTAAYLGSASFLASASDVSTAGILSQPVISAPTVTGTNRTAAQPAGGLYVNCKLQFVTITGTGFLPPTSFPSNIGVSFTPGAGITVTNVGFLSSTTLSLQVDVGVVAPTSVFVTVVNPDGGTGTSAVAVLDVGNPQSCPAQGLAPSTSSSGTATPPTVTSLTPSSGLRGSAVTIAGSNFGSTPVVSFTGPGNAPVSAPITSSTTTSLTVTVPAFPTSVADALDGPVVVTNSGLATTAGTFAVTNPRLSTVTPPSGTPGGVVLDLAGSKLQGTATVQFFNTGTTTPASGISVTSVSGDGTGQHLSVGLTANAVTGLLDVVVTNPDGGTVRLVGGFQVKTPPAAGFTFSVGGAAPSTYLPSVDAVSVTLGATGACTAKTITPHGVPLTATFTTTVGAPPPSAVTFTITSSNLPGTATNEDCELTVPASNDFSISPLGGPASVTAQQVSNVLGGGVYNVTLYSWDWGGTTTISVSGVTTVNGATQTVTGTLTLPVDTDSDKLPDAYEADATLNGNASGQNVLDRLNGDKNGNAVLDGDDRFAADGLSNFQKYRGVYLSGPAAGTTGAMSGFIRLGSGLRHLFVRGRGFGNDPAVLAAPGTCGITVGPLGPSDPTTGTPVIDASLSPTNPCPVFQVGPAFFAAGVQVHDVSASFAPGTTFPRQSLATPASPTLDMSTILYDATNCGSAAGCSTTKTGVRNWNFSPLGVSSYGTSTTYGADSRVLKKAVDAYFSDRPYQRRTAGLSPCTASSTTPCYVVGSDGSPMLTPLNLVGDSANDSGVKDTSKEVADASGQLVGDTYIAGSVSQQFSAMDVTNDGCVELPFVADPRAIPRCTAPGAASAASPQATKQQVIRSLVTHELGHNVGVNTHTTDATDIMYQYTNNWIRDGAFSPTAASLIQIHNKGLQ